MIRFPQISDVPRSYAESGHLPTRFVPSLPFPFHVDVDAHSSSPPFPLEVDHLLHENLEHWVVLAEFSSCQDPLLTAFEPLIDLSSIHRATDNRSTVIEKCLALDYPTPILLTMETELNNHRVKHIVHFMCEIFQASLTKYHWDAPFFRILHPRTYIAHRVPNWVNLEAQG